MNGHSEYLVLVGLLLPFVVHGCIANLAIRDDLVSAFTRQNEAPLQASVIIDVRVDDCASDDERCGMLVSYECP